MLANQHAHLALLSFNRSARVYHRQSKFRHHTIVLVQDLPLKHLEALFRIVGPADVHAGFVVFQVWSAGDDAIDRDVEWRAEEESDGRLYRERVNVSYPAAIATACDVTRERRVDVTIGEHDRAGFQRRNDVALGAVGEIGRVEQRERRRRKEVTFLRASCRILDEWRRVPLGEENGVTFCFEPLVEQGKLRGFTAAVGTFDDKKFARKSVFAVGDHRRRA